MRGPVHVVLLLLGCLLALVPLHLLGLPSTPAFLTVPELLRIAVGIAPVTLLPGVALVPLLLRSDVESSRGVSLPWMLLAGFGLNIAVQVLHLNLLRLLGVSISWGPLLLLTAVETGAALVALRRRDLRFRASSPGLRAGLAVLLVGLVLGGAWWRTELSRDSSWNYYDGRLPDELQASVDPGALRFERPWEAGEPFPVSSRGVELVVANEAQEPQQVPVFFLVHAPLGSTARLLHGDAVLAEATPRQMMPLDGLDALVERYWGWGSVVVRGHVPVEAEGRTTVRLAYEGAGPVTAVEWAGLSGHEVLEFMRNRGFRWMHPFQLLNVTENVRWAEEVSTDYVLSGRSPDGTSTLHQPPGWTYQYAPARRLLSGHLLTATGLFFAILLGIGSTALLAAEESTEDEPLGVLPGALLGVGVAATVLQHGRLMISDGSMNFPDSLYALALALSVVLLVTGKTRTFLLWAGLATVLRYPGAVVVVLAVLSLAFLRPDLRRRAIDAAMRFGLGVALFCGVMLLVAVATGALDAWLFALWFETIPEHFDNNPEALALWRRPLEFLRIWGLVGGGAALAAIPLRNTLSRVALATALLYAPFLAFIDHFSHHYFLPLLAFVGVAVCANVGAGDARSRVQDAAVFAVVAAGLFVAAGMVTL